MIKEELQLLEVVKINKGKIKIILEQVEWLRKKLNEKIVEIKRRRESKESEMKGERRKMKKKRNKEAGSEKEERRYFYCKGFKYIVY